MDTKWTIRSAEATDVAAVGELWQALADEHADYDAEVWCYRPDARQRWCEEFESFLGQSNKVLLVAEDDSGATGILPVSHGQDGHGTHAGGEVIGFTVCAIEDALVEMARRRGVVREVVVRASARGRGVATALMEAAFAAMKARGAEEVVLHAATDNAAAVALYEKLHLRRIMVRMYRKL